MIELLLLLVVGVGIVVVGSVVLSILGLAFKLVLIPVKLVAGIFVGLLALVILIPLAAVAIPVLCVLAILALPCLLLFGLCVGACHIF